MFSKQNTRCSEVQKIEPNPCRLSRRPHKKFRGSVSIYRFKGSNRTTRRCRFFELKNFEVHTFSKQNARGSEIQKFKSSNRTLVGFQENRTRGSEVRFRTGRCPIYRFRASIRTERRCKGFDVENFQLQILSKQNTRGPEVQKFEPSPCSVPTKPHRRFRGSV